MDSNHHRSAETFIFHKNLKVLSDMGLALCRQSHSHMAKVVLVGLDGAGKSTLLHRLIRGELAHTTPTVGFNVGSLELDSGPELTVWDIGGQGGMRAQWGDHMEECDALLFMVDGVDRVRIGEARAALGRVLGDERVRGVPLMVLVNKMDLPEAMGLQEVTGGLGLGQCWDRDWEVQGCSAHNGLGLQEALDSLATLIKKR
ncbi:ADP-ribosylation factor-like protein 11 [Oncorhynchus mykiss]|uniref:ADP-ribosylation factor-like protein 11 n=1 Tax=Oncorhynchus mykiss TaxID=8022 RepID=UPI001877FF26|nr:ADP-ribosylation factor-like protein 11 [Oncorhynchus mykiss]